MSKDFCTINLLWTYWIFESRIAITSLRGSRRALAPYAIVRWNAVEAVSVQGYRSAPFSVVESRLPLSHYKLQVVTAKINGCCIRQNRKAHLATLLFEILQLCSVTIIGLLILTISWNAVVVNLMAMHWIENCSLPACKIYLWAIKMRRANCNLSIFVYSRILAFFSRSI